MKKPDVGVMQDKIDIYGAVMAGKDLMRPGADEVMYDYVDDVEALLEYIKELEAKDAG